mmetsp:Transcript_21567/g.20716  ORF Transcript_21567/g.20716 Transcript_21567/m.20716 type:complete len:174 (-) Transcript_21567:71-592(-)
MISTTDKKLPLNLSHNKFMGQRSYKVHNIQACVSNADENNIGNRSNEQEDLEFSSFLSVSQHVVSTSSESYPYSSYHSILTGIVPETDFDDDKKSLGREGLFFSTCDFKSLKNVNLSDDETELDTNDTAFHEDTGKSRLSISEINEMSIPLPQSRRKWWKTLSNKLRLEEEKF